MCVWAPVDRAARSRESPDWCPYTDHWPLPQYINFTLKTVVSFEVCKCVWAPAQRAWRKSRLVSLHWPLASAIGQSPNTGFSLVRTPVVRESCVLIGQDIDGQRFACFSLVRTLLVRCLQASDWSGHQWSGGGVSWVGLLEGFQLWVLPLYIHSNPTDGQF